MMEPSGTVVAAVSLRDRHRAATRDALRQAGFRLFAKKGYRATSVDEIAAEAGVSRSTFFRYFGSKEALVMARSHEMGARFAELLRLRPAGERPLQALEAALVELTREAITNADLKELRRHAATFQIDPVLAAKEAEARTHWIGVISEVLAERAGRTAPTIEEKLASAILIEVSRDVTEAFRTSDDPPEEMIRRQFAAARNLLA